MVGRAVVDRTDGRIDERSDVISGQTVPFMDVAKDVVLGFDPTLNGGQKLHTACSLFGGRQIAVTCLVKRNEHS